MKHFNRIPDQYTKKLKQQGSLERFDYQLMDEKGKNIDKYVLVYLPYGYNENSDEKYNVFYLMHGATGSPDSWFGGLGGRTHLKNVLDHMIEKELIEPLIVVTPSYYTRAKRSDLSNEEAQTREFQTEFSRYLIPQLEEKYHTYAETTDDKGLIASRNHRAFGGFSMGGVTTWYAFINNLDYIKYFMPMSGDCWKFGAIGNGSIAHQKETCQFLNDVVEKSGYQPEDYAIYFSTGNKDMAYDAVKSMATGLKAYPENFVFSDNFEDGNIRIDMIKDFYHDYPYGNHYIYNGLKLFFK